MKRLLELFKERRFVIVCSHYYAANNPKVVTTKCCAPTEIALHF